MATYQNYSKDSDLKPSPRNGTDAGLGPVRDSVAALGQHIREDSLEVAKAAKSQAQKKVDEVNARASGYVETLKRDFTARPVQTAAIAFAAGAILTLLLGRRA